MWIEIRDLVKPRRRIMMIVLMVVLIISKDVFAQSRTGYGKALASYKAPEGFTITSYSNQWNTPSKLRQISKELLSNTYGEEISFLKNIYIYPDSPDGVLAYTHYDIARNYLGNYSYRPNAYIEIFDGNQYNNIQDMAWVLSHEYGHHFTIYHLINKENKFFDQWRNTGYAKARKISNNSKISYELDSIGDQYKWDIMEIAAEDYVQLFGSPSAKRSIIYKDIQQRIHENISNQFNYTAGFNMKPQENPEIPLAADVKGLEEYWRNIAGLPEVTGHHISIKPKLRIVTKKEVASGYYQYRLEWDDIPDGKEYEYTLVSYPDQEYMFTYPIKTVSSGQDTYAIVGNFLKFNPETGQKHLILDDYIGRYTFNLYIKDQNKTYSSDPLSVNFNYPIIENKGIYKDVHPQDWSYDAVKQLSERGIMVGSPDQYFYPLKGVTYSEVTTILQRMSEEKISWVNIPQDKLNDLRQKQYITRDDMSLLLYHYIRPKAFTLKESKAPVNFKDKNKILNKKEVDYLSKAGLIGGNNGCYYPQNNVTREELASVMMRILNINE